jgi:hypothetical protein
MFFVKGNVGYGLLLFFVFALKRWWPMLPENTQNRIFEKNDITM